MGQRHTRRFSLSPMAQEFVPGAQDYGGPLPHVPPHYTPSPLSQIHNSSSSRFPRLPSPEFPFYNTDRPYYRDEWTKEDRASYQLEQDQPDQAQSSAESKEESITDDSTSTEQGKSGPQLGMTNQDRRSDDRAASTSHMDRTIDCSSPNKTFDDHNTYQSSPASTYAIIETSTPNPYSNDNGDTNTTIADYHPLSSILATIDIELPSIATTDAEIDRWHSDALLPPSSRRWPQMLRTPNHEPGAIGDERKNAVEYAMKRERFKREHIAAARAFADPFGTRKGIRFSNRMGVKEENNETVGGPWPARLGGSSSGGVHAGFGNGGPTYTIGRQMHHGAVLRTQQASHDSEKQKNTWGRMQGADGKMVARRLSPEEGEGNSRDSRNGRYIDNKVYLT
ncbi:uncharacterized protein LTHEOB_7588 [Lasiodiplodia theobromae]|uniref:uncharacterized protein n=1 Tax=Lasiodiplodia theobromae TaxID=45133 RepID=UPI0015C3B843|nr:uncharacterized protein LTHEOB_7588 [Lasiodiplodia theobromae]KAF4542396.1 hypothetical protein LTHEOB_7588 [Lasiodiplodia theobromae]